MDNYIVSARKYRPQTFKSVVGQLSLTTTLKNAITSGHLAHAYLFCGPRGVGKTTCARIFAKTINCEHLTAEHEACNECESCVSFNEQRSYNIHELDAASNNSVDDIRTLIDQVRIPPQIGKYSVYIVDEVHMLSSGAFNAFLKTLEEPPAHAIFILATTEKHKILPTILSRCQIYDFNRITISDTVRHLQYVAESEGVQVESNALHVVAQKSDGGMRDALSIFDQLVSFCGNNITYQAAIDNLNVLDYEYYFKLVDAMLAGQVSASLLIFNDVLNRGFDGQHFITGFSAHLRDLLVSKDAATLQLLEVGENIAARYHKQSKVCSNEFLFQALKFSNDCDLNYRLSRNKRLLVEIALIKICQLNDEKKKLILNEEHAPLKPLQPENDKTAVAVQTPAANYAPTAAPETPAPSPIAAKPLAPTTPTAPTVAATPSPAVGNSAAPKPTISAHRPTSISINKSKPTAEANNTHDATAATQAAPIMDQAYSMDDFVKSWYGFAAKIKEDVNRVSFNTFSMPIQAEQHRFVVYVSNTMQANNFKKFQPYLVSHLRNELKNSNVTVEHVQVEESAMPKTVSPEERYKQFAEINPAVEVLRKKIQLEID